MRSGKIRCLVGFVSVVMLCVCVLFPGFAEDANNYSYTYNYDYWKNLRESPDVYRVKAVLDTNSLKLDKALNNPQGLFVIGNDIYLCDTGNKRVIQIHCDGEEYTVTRIIDTINGAEPATFAQPTDIFVDKEGTMYVCDPANGRIVKMDKDCNYIMSFVRPSDETFDPSFAFLPSKAVVDASGRVYAICTNVNKGFVKYEADGFFTGFFGAMEAKYEWSDYIWKMLSTKEQRAQMVAFVPTEYENVCIDSKGFLYATIASFVNHNVAATKPIRRINSIGKDILIRNSANGTIPQGDLEWGEVTGAYSGASRFTDVTVLHNGIYVGLDRTRGRLFGYDSQGNLLWAFAGIGPSNGYFDKPVALEHMGYDLMVLDTKGTNVTIFSPTEYGALIYQATEEYLRGAYDDSAASWEKVLTYNGNYDMAYVGIGRAQLRNDQYEEAMKNFQIARDTENYGEAFQLYRKEVIEDNVGWVVAIIVIAIIVPKIIKRIKKIRAEVNAS